MANVQVEFLSEHTDHVRAHLTRFFQERFATLAGNLRIAVRYGGHGWRVVLVDPSRHAADVRKALHEAGGGDEQRGRRR